MLDWRAMNAQISLSCWATDSLATLTPPQPTARPMNAGEAEASHPPGLQGFSDLDNEWKDAAVRTTNWKVSSANTKELIINISSTNTE